MTKAQIKRRLKKCFAIFHRMGLKNKSFSILSNNCWGGAIYDKYALPYLSPTIGLWLPPKDYIRFLKNPSFYAHQPLKRITYEESHVADILLQRKREGRYTFPLEDLIIGRIADVDIIFLHYSSFEEAREKWKRRVKRINYDNLLVKMNDQNGCTDEDFAEFLNLPYQHKIFLTARREWAQHDGVVFMEQYEENGYVKYDTIRGSIGINTTKVLNSMLVEEREE